MLTDTDFKRIQKLFLNIATKENIREVKEELADLRETIQALSVSVERFVKIASDLKEEHAAISVQLTRHERWFKE
ncbi:MAG TPA: hypothetical protein VJJ55_01255, partial [Candidatus Paceibacterota bacterium]